jgi:hypothetical protein
MSDTSRPSLLREERARSTTAGMEAMRNAISKYFERWNDPERKTGDEPSILAVSTKNTE